MQIPDDIYTAVELLINRLKQHPTSKLSVILDHRMHNVAWTTGDELFEELHKVLKNALVNESDLLDFEEQMQINQILGAIKKQIHRVSYA